MKWASKVWNFGAKEIVSTESNKQKYQNPVFLKGKKLKRRETETETEQGSFGSVRFRPELLQVTTLGKIPKMPLVGR